MDSMYELGWVIYGRNANFKGSISRFRTLVNCRKSVLGKFGKFKSSNFLDMKNIIVIYPWFFKTAYRIN